MKKIMLFIYVVLGFNIFAYEFPLKDPYLATVVGTSTLMTKGIKEKIPLEIGEMKLINTRETPKNMDYQKQYKFSMALQNKKAPLIFILSGTGSSSTSLKTRYFERIFYTAGYHVVGVSSIMNSNSVVSLSYGKMPGNLMEDSLDIYRAIKHIKKYVEKKVEIEDYNLVGYSLGGTHSAVLGFIDENEKEFNFNKIYMINPAVNLFDSAKLLDKMFDDIVREDITILFDKVNELTDKLASKKFINITNQPELMLRELEIDDEDLKIGIGLVFRLAAVDIHFLTDASNARKVYVKNEVEKFEDMDKYLKAINFSNFEEYISKIAYPYYKERYGNKLDMNKLTEFSDLNIIQKYLENAKNIHVVTNRDELILTNKNLKYLEKTFKGRIKVYPYGGHCGNMYYQENVDHMLNTFKEGR